MVQEMWAKVNARERLIAYGVGVVIIAWLLGLIITGRWYDASGAQGLGLLAVIAAVVAGAAIYVHVAPNMSFTWPAPYPLILLVLSAIVAIIALIGLLQVFTYDPFGGLGAVAQSLGISDSKPITVYVVALGVLVGGGLMAWGAYQEYSQNKPTV